MAYDQCEESMLPPLITSAIVFAVSTPLYIYFVCLWYHFRQHFLISQRFPIACNGIIFASYFNLAMMTARNFIYIEECKQNTFNYIAHVFFSFCTGYAPSFIATSLVVYRLLLVYLRFHSIQKLQTLNGHELLNASLSIYKHRSSISFVIFIVVAWILGSLQQAQILGFWVYMIDFPGIIIIAIVVIVFIKRDHIKEGLGCVKETYILLSYVFFIIVAAMTVNTAETTIARYCSLSVTIGFVSFQGLLPIIISLYYIRQCEGSWSIRKWKTKLEPSMFTCDSTHNNPSQLSLERVATASVNDECSINVIYSQSDSVNNNNGNIGAESPTTLAINFDLPFFEFIKKKEHYNAFKDYLGYVFALENLLFYEKVSIFYQIVLKCKRHAKITSGDNNERDAGIVKRLKLARFTYSDIIWEKYSDLVSPPNNVNDNGDGFDYYKQKLYMIGQEIYQEFVSGSTETQVNLSHNAYTELSYLFGDGENIDKFESYDDFLNLFESSLMDICRLLLSVYGYRFREYIESKYFKI